MKKHIITAIVIFILITGLSLASNLIGWNEALWEQDSYTKSIYIGALLEALPLILIIGLYPSLDFIFTITADRTNYQLLAYILPFITGMCYAIVYYLIATLIRKFKVNKLDTKITKTEL